MGELDVVIRVEGLGKKYTIKHEQQVRHNTLRDAVAHQASAVGRWANPFTLAGQLRRAGRHADYLYDRGEEDFWALKDVSFEIRRGERVGIIGRNGAGKSTLLKILSRITEPTTGRVEIRGRVASLLEVGTGFHPELTGRENIYLNGAILGMTRREIRSKFDEIVDFAEVEKFLDTPVKRYSSGMYVRLAFAVAAHLEPEILVVDEVLAVGDASFQKKCLGKMEDVATREGRTILLVSHQMNVIRTLASQVVLLSSGSIAKIGNPDEAIIAYRDADRKAYVKKNESIHCDVLSLHNISLRPPGKTVEYTEKLRLSFDIEIHSNRAKSARLIMSLINSFGEKLFSSAIQLDFLNNAEENIVSVIWESPEEFLKDGNYDVSISVGIPGQQKLIHERVIASFQLANCFTGSYYPDAAHWPGAVLPRCNWIINEKNLTIIEGKK
jgi:lipopolysaccharide transport system ATP-binding protein